MLEQWRKCWNLGVKQRQEVNYGRTDQVPSKIQFNVLKSIERTFSILIFREMKKYSYFIAPKRHSTQQKKFRAQMLKQKRCSNIGSNVETWKKIETVEVILESGWVKQRNKVGTRRDQFFWRYNILRFLNRQQSCSANLILKKTKKKIWIIWDFNFHR